MTALPLLVLAGALHRVQVNISNELQKLDGRRIAQ
jgi:hypothetical protein